MSTLSHAIRKFDRFELKYLVPAKAAEVFKQALRAYLVPDDHGNALGCYHLSSLYYDGPSFCFYWEKANGVKFRRKLRIRHYDLGQPLTAETPVFVEIKQRLNKVTQKRRIVLPYGQARQLCDGRRMPEPAARACAQADNGHGGAVLDEIVGMLSHYNLRPASIVSYTRHALIGTEYDAGLRVTFDTDLIFRADHLDLASSLAPPVSSASGSVPVTLRGGTSRNLPPFAFNAIIGSSQSNFAGYGAAQGDRLAYLTATWKLGLLAMFTFFVGDRNLAPVSQPASTPPCVVFETGDLAGEIGSIVAQMPGPGSNGMVVPSTEQMAAWGVLLDAVQAGDLDVACDTIAVQAFPYRIVRYTDSGYDDTEYLILEESAPTSVGWGTYVIADEAETGLVLEVPHPGCEWKTEEEGVELLRHLRARALLVAGTHRCANVTYSPCSGTTSFCGVEEPHRTSDVAHATQTIFFASHRALVPPGSDRVAVQLHGCSDPTCPDLFISNGTCAPGELAYEFYRQALSACGPLSVDVADCEPLECSFVGTTNVQGRYSNGFSLGAGFEACTMDASGPSDPEQFLHLEQSRALRDHFGCLALALRRTFTEPYQQYLPAVSLPSLSQAVDARWWSSIHMR